MSARTLTGALALAGGVLLVVSLFVSWYDPGVDAWTAFEVFDLVLAAAGAYGAVLGASIFTGERWPVPGRGPLLIGGAAFVIVVLQLLQPPPAVHGADLRTGAWLGLVASAMLLAAGWLATGGRTPGPRRPRPPGEAAPPPRRPPP
jgi:hypothetical protein